MASRPDRYRLGDRGGIGPGPLRRHLVFSIPRVRRCWRNFIRWRFGSAVIGGRGRCGRRGAIRRVEITGLRFRILKFLPGARLGCIGSRRFFGFLRRIRGGANVCRHIPQPGGGGCHYANPDQDRQNPFCFNNMYHSPLLCQTPPLLITDWSSSRKSRPTGNLSNRRATRTPVSNFAYDNIDQADVQGSPALPLTPSNGIT